MEIQVLVICIHETVDRTEGKVEDHPSLLCR